MHDSPMSATPYDVLGVPPTASEEDLRRAYRRALRLTHPDTGGDAARFHAVQRAWELVGTVEARAAYDRGRPPGTARREPDAAHAWSVPRTEPPRGSRPPARSHGHPGGWSREQYLTLLREWVGRGAELADPYDPALVRRAPLEVRHLLAQALAEEETARQLAGLGIGFTLWHDVATDAAGAGLPPKLDHLVLGPSGLFAVQSEDWGAPVRVRRGELAGEGIGRGERPVHALSLRARAVSRAARVRVTGLVVVVPDDASAEPLALLGSPRGAVRALVRRSVLPGVVRDGLPGAARIGGTEIFEVRTRLQGAIRFV